MIFSEFSVLGQFAIIFIVLAWAAVFILELVMGRHLKANPTDPPNCFLPVPDLTALRISQDPKRHLTPRGIELYRWQRIAGLIFIASGVIVVIDMFV